MFPLDIYDSRYFEPPRRAQELPRAKSSIQQALETNDLLKIKQLLFEKNFSPDDFISVCIQQPEIALRAIRLCPNSVKGVSAALLATLLASENREELFIEILTNNQFSKLDFVDHGLLVKAIFWGRLQAAEKLLDLCDVNELWDLKSPLDCAIEHGYMQLVTKLLGKGANPYLNKRKAFTLAKQSGNKVLADLLQKYEVSHFIEEGDVEGIKHTFLLLQADDMNEEECFLLWQRYPELAMENIANFSKLKMCIPIKQLEALCKENDVRATAFLRKLSPDELAELCIAFPNAIIACMKHSDCLSNCSAFVLDRLLQTYGNDESIEDLLCLLMKSTARVQPRHLHQSIARGFTRAAIQLVDAGVVVDGALHAAVEKGYLELVAKFIEKKCSLFSMNEKNQTAKELSEALGFTEITEMLTEAEFIYAVNQNLKQKIEVMIQAKVKVSQQRFISLCFTKTEIAQRIAPWHAEHLKAIPPEKLFDEVVNEKTFLQLLDLDKDLSKLKNKNGQTLLHAAVKLGSLVVVERLITLGLDVSATDLQSNTPLEYAIQRNCDAILDALIQAGASPFLGRRIHGKSVATRILESKNPESSEAILKTISPVCASFVRDQFIEQQGGVKEICDVCKSNLRIIRSLVGVDSSPLEVAFLLSSEKLGRLIFSQISYEHYLQGIELLCERFPDSRDLIIELFFDANTVAWHKTVPAEHCFEWVKEKAKPLTLPISKEYKQQKEALQQLQAKLIKEVFKPTGKLMEIKQAVHDATCHLSRLKTVKLQAQTNWYLNEKTKLIKPFAFIVALLNQKILKPKYN